MKDTTISSLKFLDEQQVRDLCRAHKAPFYVISKKKLKEWADIFKSAIATLPYGGGVKFAVKANPHPEVITLFRDAGIGIDASSYYEAKLALSLGVPGEQISLTSQELPPDDESFIFCVQSGIHFNATSLHQLSEFCRLFPGTNVGVRINPGIGSGYNKRLTTGGASAGFGIWYEYGEEMRSIAAEHSNTITTLHTHIGTGTDPMEWLSALDTTLSLVRDFPDVTTISIGGGFKARYMPEDHDADMHKIMNVLAQELEKFKTLSSRELSLEIEPGRLLVVHAGSLVSEIIDLTDTGRDGYRFIRLNTGMTEILRPAMYGSQHELVVVPRRSKETTEVSDYIVVGHCCESSDCLTTGKGNPEEIETRALAAPEIGDYMVIEEVGAYCYGMSAVGYNSFPEAPVIVVE